MDTAPSISLSKRAARSLPGGMAGTACRSGQRTCGQRSFCGSRFAGSASDSIHLEIRAAVLGPRWWTISSPIAGTGGCLWTLPTTRVCASTTTTRRRPGNRRKSAGKTQEIDHTNALGATSVRRHACPRLGMRVAMRAGQAKGLLPRPHPGKVLGGGAQDPAAPRL